MTTPIVALSLSDQVEKFGAYAGFAAVLGLAVLALLYFASAREVKRLREWADRAPERVADLEARLAEVTRQRAAVPKPVGKGAAATGSAPATAAALAAKKPVATSGNGAEGDAPPLPGKAAPATASAAATTAQGDGPADAGDKPFDASEQAPDLTQIKRPAKKGPPQPADQTLVGAAGRELRQNRPSARPRPQPPVRPSTARLMESARASNAQRRAGQPPGRGGSPPPVQDDGSNLKRVLLIAGAVVAAIVVAVLLVTVVFSGGGDSGPGAAATRTTQPTVATEEPGAGVDRANTEVAVLNGTTFTGLASGVSNTLENVGWKTGEVTNAPDQTRSATIVEYTEGHKEEALEVAKSIPGVDSDAVVPIGEGSRVLAPAAAVVVTVGSDQTPTGTG